MIKLIFTSFCQMFFIICHRGAGSLCEQKLIQIKWQKSDFHQELHFIVFHYVIVLWEMLRFCPHPVCHIQSVIQSPLSPF